uniref:DNA-directed RNA polymerase subunit beta n=2 Tax=Chenopodium quinoa TaxID=63459 RepID=A0A803N1C3_CHEQI
MDTSSNGKDGFDDIDPENWDDEGMYSSDEDADTMYMSLDDLGEASLTNFCKKASSSFFKQYGLISHQINSYNSFVREGIKRVFDNIGEITVNPGYDPSKKVEGGWRYASVIFGKFELERPMFWTGEKFQADGGKDYIKLLPRHARLQKMTYSARLKVETRLQIYTLEKVISDKFKTGKSEYIDRTILSDETTDVIIGRIPVMVKSDICWMSQAEKGDCEFDHGGYFIVKGAEKVFIAQEQICLNRLWISSERFWRVAYRSEFRKRRLHVKLAENPKVENIRGGEKVISVYFAFVEVPIWILFFALGVSSDKEVVELIDCSTDDGCISNILFASIHDADEKCDGFRRGGKALEHIDHLIKQSKFPPSESAAEYIETYLFPSLSRNKQKARFLGYMVKCLLQAFLGRRKCDNRDDLRNRRLECASELLERELRVLMKQAEWRMVKAMQRDLYGNRDLQGIEHYLDASIVTNGLNRAFSIGAWEHPYKRSNKVSGVSANLRRTNPLQSTCDMRRTRQHVAYTGKVGDARYPHPSHWGKVCFLSTPDGENCGLVKNIAATGLVSCSISKKGLPDILVKCGMEKLVSDTCTSLGGKDKVFVDGDWVGVCADSLSFVQELRRNRRKKRISSQVEIKRDVQNSEVRIFCDAGRILRPLLVVENLKKTKLLKGDEFSFETLLDKGIIELIGPEEEEDCRAAWGIKFLFEDKGKDAVKYTHCELDMSFLLGISCGIIPFANHDHAKRVLYQAQKHSGQAFGYSSTNPNIRVDTLSHQMYYPQRPLFRSVISDCLGKPGYPLGRNQILPKVEFFSGQNCIVAVNVHLGYNQEDSLVMSRASLERGMFRTEHFRSYKAEVDNQESSENRRNFNDTVKFGKIQSKIGRADNLDDDGFPYIGANLQSGDIIIGRCAESGADHSVKLRHTEKGMVQKVVLSANDDGKNFAVVSLRQVRSPCLGDKFSSMHGQKGVIGHLESQENFPFTKQGIVPDIVINPHSFPNRQTPGQLLEAALGKGIACGGSLKYATPFSTPSVESITEQLHRAGFSRWGNERVYNGRTGEMIRTLLFMGPTFYQRLDHMSEDRYKFRNTGPVLPLTRQPVLDKKRFGGIRFGEMERECLIAHGASANLHERLFTLSDASQMHVCRKCQNIANVILRTVPGGKKIRGPYCRFCESGEEIVKVNVPYGAKLLCQELFSMGISLRFDTKLC